MLNTVKEGLKSKEGKAVLYAGLIGLVLSDIIPTPADAIYFTVERNLRDKWKRGEITPKQYWTKTTASYYLLNPLWWGIVSAITLSVKGDAEKKLKVAGALIGSGIAFAVIYKNIKKDNKDLEQEKVEREKLLAAFPEIAPIMNTPQFKNFIAEELRRTPPKH